VSFKKKRIPHELIIRESEWEQPYEKNRWLLWSIAALLCAGVLSLIVVLSLFPGFGEANNGSNPSSVQEATDGSGRARTETRIVVPIDRDVPVAPDSSE